MDILKHTCQHIVPVTTPWHAPLPELFTGPLRRELVGYRWACIPVTNSHNGIQLNHVPRQQVWLLLSDGGGECHGSGLDLANSAIEALLVGLGHLWLEIVVGGPHVSSLELGMLRRQSTSDSRCCWFLSHAHSSGGRQTRRGETAEGLIRKNRSRSVSRRQQFPYDPYDPSDQQTLG
jgi:hypothetical protein